MTKRKFQGIRQNKANGKMKSISTALPCAQKCSIHIMNVCIGFYWTATKPLICKCNYFVGFERQGKC